MNKLIENIVHNEVERLLNESLTDIIYHFTDLKSAYQIVRDNCVLLSENFYDVEQREIGSNYNYYLSFTRQKHGKLGYSSGKAIRIIFDGSKLSQKYKGKAFDFYPGSNSEMLQDKYRGLDENEDRLYSNTPAIENASKYILGIDINLKNKKYIKIIHEMINIATFPIHIYLNEKDFFIGNNNYITSLENLARNSENFEFQKHNENEYIEQILNCITYMFKYFIAIIESKNKDFDRKKFMTFYLNRYDLSKFGDRIINNVLYDINLNMSQISYYEPTFLSYFDALRLYIPKTYVKITKMYMALTKKVKNYE